MCQCHCYKIYSVCVFHLVSCHINYHVTNVTRGTLWATNKLSDSRSKVKVIVTFFLHEVGGHSFILPPLPVEGGGILFYLCLSVHPSKIFFVVFFSATIDGRNLIFGHKLHIGMPYCG